MNTPQNLKYTDTHEWVRTETDGTVSIGITFHAQDQLGDVVFVEPPAVGRQLKQREECGVIESVKAAADLYAPLSGEVVATNAELADAPEKINQAPYDSWLFRMKPAAASEMQALIDAAAYDKIAAAEKP